MFLTVLLQNYIYNSASAILFNLNFHVKPHTSLSLTLGRLTHCSLKTKSECNTFS